MLKCLECPYSSSILALFLTSFLLSFFFISTPLAFSFSQRIQPHSSLPVARVPTSAARVPLPSGSLMTRVPFVVATCLDAPRRSCPMGEI